MGNLFSSDLVGSEIHFSMTLHFNVYTMKLVKSKESEWQAHVLSRVVYQYLFRARSFFSNKLLIFTLHKVNTIVTCPCRFFLFVNKNASEKRESFEINIFLISNECRYWVFLQHFKNFLQLCVLHAIFIWLVFLKAWNTSFIGFTSFVIRRGKGLRFFPHCEQNLILRPWTVQNIILG